MNGKELIDFIKKNHLEDYVFKAMIIPINLPADEEEMSMEEITERDIDIKGDNTVEIF